mmetsp:Transcript_33160/g.97834  ORF Transcript_33160/g.97834 Transcript_33160/m.97834 type:complete len:736 (-) Transcript_33160:59-2266(-)
MMMPTSSSQSRPAPQAAAADDVDSLALNELARVNVPDVDEDLDTKPAARPVSSPARKPAAAQQQPQQQPRRPVPALLATSWDVQVSIYTYLRATDLSSLQRVSRHFHNRRLVNAIVRHTAEHVYPPALTNGFDTPEVGGPVNTQTNEGGPDVLTYEMLRNMEMLVVARVLSRPEPPLKDREAGFYVSKSWCRTALRWLEVQQEEQREAAKQRGTATAATATAAAGAGASAGAASRNPRNPHASSKKKKKPTRKDRKQERLRHRKMSDATPPWGNINHDIVCPHGDLARCSSKSARARRRTMDKQAWKVLNKLYPASVPLSSVQTECVQCIMEQEAEKKNEADRREREKEERKRPLSCSIVRGIYTRSKGVPASCLAQNAEDDDNDLDRKPSAVIATPAKTTTSTGTNHPQQRQCPLVPGIYNALPRSWCHQWRKFLKIGDGERPVAPDATALLCDAHRLPLVPPHLETYLYGDTPTLLVGSGNNNAPYFADDADAPLTGPSTPATASAVAAPSPFSATPVGYNPIQSHSTEEPDNADTTYGAQAAAAAAASEKEEEEEAIIVALRAAGLSEAELNAQRLAMQNHERQSHMAAATASASSSSLLQSPSGSFRRQSSVATPNTPITPGNAPNADGADGATRESINEQLDRENYRVVEILTDEEFTALEKWWPDISVNYALRFAVTEDDVGGRSIVWSTAPCRECDASGKNCQEFAGMRMSRARRIRRDGHVPNGKGR